MNTGKGVLPTAAVFASYSAVSGSGPMRRTAAGGSASQEIRADPRAVDRKFNLEPRRPLNRGRGKVNLERVLNRAVATARGRHPYCLRALILRRTFFTTSAAP